MKLKKIASLALAGIMAVSMLAGCSNGNSNSGNTEEPVAPSTGVSAKVQSLLKNDDLITLSDNSTYSSYLDSAIKKADVDAATMGEMNGSNNVDDDILNVLKSKFEDNVVKYDSGNSFRAANLVKVSLEDDVVLAYALAFDGKMSEEVVLNALATKMDAYVVDSVLVSDKTDSSGKHFVTIDYTGSVSLQKVSKDGVSTWIALFVVNSDVTRTEINK